MSNGLPGSFFHLVTAEDVACIDLVLYIVKDLVIAVGDDSLALTLEIIQIVYHLTAEEG